jgi:hypothetical protein
MALTYDGSEGLFTRLGRIGDLYLTTVTNVGSALDTAVEDIRDEYESGNEGGVLDNIYAVRNAYRNSPSGFLQSLSTYAQNTTIEQVNRETPLLSKTLANAVLELKRLMIADSETIARPTISAAHSADAGNEGDAVFVTSMVDEYGQPTEQCFAEDVKFICTADVSSGATQYRETFSIAGEPAVAATDVNWPAGSGASGSISLFDASSQNDLISNGGFDTWTNAAAAPESWTIVTGSAGTTVERDSSLIKWGAYSIRFDSDGSTLLAVKQQLSTSLVKPNKVYLLNLWAKVDTLDASGIVRFRLVDGSGAVISNDAGTTNSYTRNVNGNIGTTYTNVSTSFQTPKQLPSTGVFLLIEFSTSPANSRTVNFDLVSLVEGQRLYASGPLVRGFSSAAHSAVGDRHVVATANNAANASFVRFLQRVLGLATLGPAYQLPSIASTNTIDDALLA